MKPTVWDLQRLILGTQPGPTRGFAAMSRTILITAAVLAALPAFAQVPDYDTVRHCTEFANGSQTAENQCRREEADARRELETTRASQDVRTYCEEQIRTEQSYVLLFGCTLNETEARANQGQPASVGMGSTSAPDSNAGAEPADRTPRGSGPISVTHGPKATIENRAGH